jgi:hypothetical protein
MKQNETKRELIRRLLKEHPEWSNRKISEETKKFIKIELPKEED